MSTVFVDRESTYPGRYRVIPESGNPYHIILERDDEPVTPGTPLNAETFNGMRDEIDAELAKKAPDRFGVGESTIEPPDSDLNKATGCGWYAFTNSTQNRPFDYGIAMVMNRYGGNVLTQVAFNPMMAGNGEMCVRHFYDNTWREWEYINPPMKSGVVYRTVERIGGKVVYKKADSNGVVYLSTDNTTWKSQSEWIGAAPSGYGLGETAQGTKITSATEVDSIKKNGWYALWADYNITFAGYTDSFFTLEVSMFNDNYGRHTLYFQNGSFITRTCRDCVWGEWEWVNPPMKSNVVYRTVDRIDGNAVYKKCDSNGVVYWSTDQTTWQHSLNNVLSAEDYGTTLPTAGTKGRIFFKKV